MNDSASKCEAFAAGKISPRKRTGDLGRIANTQQHSSSLCLSTISTRSSVGVRIRKCGSQRASKEQSTTTEPSFRMRSDALCLNETMTNKELRSTSERISVRGIGTLRLAINRPRNLKDRVSQNACRYSHPCQSWQTHCTVFAQGCKGQPQEDLATVFEETG